MILSRPDHNIILQRSRSGFSAYDLGIQMMSFSTSSFFLLPSSSKKVFRWPELKIRKLSCSCISLFLLLLSKIKLRRHLLFSSASSSLKSLKTQHMVRHSVVCHKKATIQELHAVVDFVTILLSCLYLREKYINPRILWSFLSSLLPSYFCFLPKLWYHRW